MGAFFVVILVFGFLVFIGILSTQKLINICAPNEVLIFSGRSRVVDGQKLGYRLVKGGRGIRIPLIERVDKIDLTNMVIDVAVHNAYSKGGVPLTVQSSANVKIAGYEPVLNHAIERFIGKSRDEVIEIAKANLEGSLRGVLSTLTPEQVNDDKILFAEKLVHEVEADMTKLGFVVDSLKIQNVQDEVQYLDSIGRRKNAEIVSKARIAEAIAKADAVVRSAENEEREVNAQIDADIAIAKAEADQRLADTLSRRDALVAEEQAEVMAAVAQAEAEIEVQKARVEKMKHQYEADIIQPARAECEAMENRARSTTAPIIEAGKAKADALRVLAKQYNEAGDKGREILVVQKLQPIIEQLTSTIADSEVEKLTVLGSQTSAGKDPMAVGAYRLLEQVKEVFGIDILDAINKKNN